MSKNIEKNIAALWERIRNQSSKTMMDTIGIQFTEITSEYVRGKMPVDHRTVQYYGMLHGGASVAFAESLASCAASIHIDQSKSIVVGLEINANHLRSTKSGLVFGEAKPIHIGRTTQVWSVEMKNEEGKLLCISRCTIAVIPNK